MKWVAQKWVLLVGKLTNLHQQQIL